MDETLTVTTERVDDIAVLQAQMGHMGLVALFDKHFPAHGNWQGLSLGWVVDIWLTHILSEADHRLNHVQPWAEKRLETLRRCTGQALRALDLSDDRLASVAKSLSDDARWQAFEQDLTSHLLRVYDLSGQRVRLDSTAASGYGRVTEDGLFQFGHSKDHRPDLPQVKVMLSTLDPLGLPVATQVVSGEQADDPLYIPAITQVRASLGRQGLLYIGDCKMAAVGTRAFIQAGGDFYLCSLPQRQVSSDEMDAYLRPVWTGEQPVTPIERETGDGETERLAEGYERTEQVTAVVNGGTITWTERRLVIRSLHQAKVGAQALQQRLQAAQAALLALNDHKQGKRRVTDAPALYQKAMTIMQHFQVEGLLSVHTEEISQERPLRRYGTRPAAVRVEREYRLQVTVDEAALTRARARLGWRVYATNQPAEQLSVSQAVLAYRHEYLIERGFGRLKGKPLSLTPMYLQDDDHATGLIRLLSIGLRVLTLVEGVVRRGLAEQKAHLAGLYAGNPKRKTASPTAELLLEAFQEITLTVVTIGEQVKRHLTPLSPVQQQILTLLDFSSDVYTKLAADSLEPT
jgi:transposase